MDVDLYPFTSWFNIIPHNEGMYKSLKKKMLRFDLFKEQECFRGVEPFSNSSLNKDFDDSIKSVRLILQIARFEEDQSKSNHSSRSSDFCVVSITFQQMSVFLRSFIQFVILLITLLLRATRS